MVRLVLLYLAFVAAVVAGKLDIAPFAKPCCSADKHTLQTTFDYKHPAGVVGRADGTSVYGLQWAEERDLSEVAVEFQAPYDAAKVKVEYWSSRWPYPKPGSGHSLEDPADDPWQGQWTAVAAVRECNGASCRFRFPALAVAENPQAVHLPGVLYRRTLKLRLIFPDRPAVRTVRVFTESEVRRFTARLRFCEAGKTEGVAKFEAYNGVVVRQTASGCDAEVEVDGADPKPAGSNDITTVKVERSGKRFSFAPADLERGAMRIPSQGVVITGAGGTDVGRTFGKRIRERILTEPEQSYERAAREIPALDPVTRSSSRLELPLSLDASWQKFGFQWGGHVRISKRGTKAYGKELARLAWPGDEIFWRIGTGAQAAFRDAADASTMSQLEDALPIGTVRWQSDNLTYEEEAFATTLGKTLSPEGEGRDEQAPSVLLIRLKVRNASSAAQAGHVWLAMKPGEPLAFDGTLLTASNGRFVRAAVQAGAGVEARTGTTRDGTEDVAALHLSKSVAAGQEWTLTLAVPFVPELSAAERVGLARLGYDGERARVLAYWRKVTDGAVPFEVPEERFNSFAKGLLARIRMATTKDPKSGLYMVPAANIRYRVYANEAAFQCQLLDLVGNHEQAAQYLQTPVTLQGSKPLTGSFTGDQRDVYHGARVDEVYDYTATPYNLNHGTVLWTLGEHYLVTRDRAWLGRVMPSMKRAAKWIVDQRALTQTVAGSAEYGLLPAGHLEDNKDWGHWFSVNAYASLGMTTLGEVLADVGDPEAAWFQQQARAYRVDLRAAVLRAAENAPVVRMRDGSYAPYVPTMAHQRLRFFGPLRVAYYTRYGLTKMPTFRLSATRELLFGPLTLIETGVFGPDEPIGEWLLDDWEDNLTTSEPLGLGVHGWVDEEYWFSRGGMVFQANLQNPIRSYLRRGEIRAAVRSLYNDFVSCHYPSVNILTEEYRQWRFPSGPFFKVADEAKFLHRLRDLLILEQGRELDLAKGTPEAWLAEGKRIKVSGAPTVFGPVSYQLESVRGAVRGTVSLPTRNPADAAWISVRLPGSLQIDTVTVDGNPIKSFDSSTGRIRLPQNKHQFQLLVTTKAK